MRSQYKLVVFDWEGTIAEDGLGVMIQILSTEAAAMHLRAVDPLMARRYIGLGIGGAVKQLYPDLFVFQQEQLVAATQNKMTQFSQDVMLIPGALEVIRTLHAKNVMLAIATNKGHLSLQRAMQCSGLDRYFSTTRSASQTAPKPCPQMLEEILDIEQCLPEHTLMIGDSVSDVQMASALNVDCLGVDFYQVQQNELLAAGALQVLGDYQQVKAFLHI